MALVLLFLFLSVPLLEIWLFIEAGSAFGVWPTVGLTLLTAVIGTALVRYQGLSAIARARVDLERNRLPLSAILDGVGLLMAGFALITPGFFTDATGFLLLIPPVRRTILALLAARLAARSNWRVLRTADPGGPQPAAPQRTQRAGQSRTAETDRPAVVIDAEFEEMTAGQADEKPHSPWKSSPDRPDAKADGGSPADQR